MNIIFWIGPNDLPLLQQQLDKLDESKPTIITAPYQIHSGFVQATLPYKTWAAFRVLKIIE
jgi:hypothetical protein